MLALLPAAPPCVGFVTTHADRPIAASDAQQAIRDVDGREGL